MDTLEDVEAFLRQQLQKTLLQRSLWFNLPHLSVYLRAGAYHLPPNADALSPRLHAVGISNVKIDSDELEPKHTGHLRDFMCWLEDKVAELKYPVIRVEQVHSDRLKDILLRHGYSVYSSAGFNDAPIFVKYVQPIALA